jgi:hypothetical protein
MREMIKNLLKEKYLIEYRSLIGVKFRVITLGKKGYDLVHNCYQTLGVLEIENSKRTFEATRKHGHGKLLPAL